MSATRPFTDAETKAIMRALKSTRDRCLFLLGCRTGLRIMELLSLKVSDVAEIEGDRIRVRERCVVRKLKGGGSREIVLQDECRKLIGQHIRENKLGASDHLFKSREGGRRAIDRTQAWRILKTAAKKLDGKIGCHSMRKYFASKMYRHFKGDLIPVAEALGHKSLENTRAYVAFETQRAVDRAVRSIW